MSRGRELTDQEKENVIKLWSEGMGKKSIGITLGIDYKPLKRFFDENNIANRKQGIPYEFYEPIFELYSSGLTLQQIHDLHFSQFTTDQINYICREKGITRPNGKVAILNHDYFDKIDSNEKAYWLGLITADGSIRLENKNSWSVTLELMKEDKYLVELFAKAVETNLEVKEYINSKGFQKQNGDPHIECRIVLNSAKMAKDLIEKYNLMPRKSLLLTKLPEIEEKYMSHFIRGFIDGNGSFTYNKTKGKKVYKLPRILIYSTHAYCDELNKYLEEKVGIKINKVYDQKHEQVSFISFSIFEDIIKLYEYLYKDATIYMKRKRNKIEDLISEYRDNHAA